MSNEMSNKIDTKSEKNVQSNEQIIKEVREAIARIIFPGANWDSLPELYKQRNLALAYSILTTIPNLKVINPEAELPEPDITTSAFSGGLPCLHNCHFIEQKNMIAQGYQKVVEVKDANN